MRLRATIRARRQPNKFSRRGFMYCYYMEVRDDTGRLWASDNTGDWRVMYDLALWHMETIKEAWTIGVLKP
ncbi:hypothetical protein [Arthrobacter roseus]|uniref:hypothetical protein n=1 Tax=Arthrobacter roseus TaxID=136274 RepID=UPI001965B800|nr:hypothetical protein [Arthrobacter roseus]MBM7847496.1 hypothetical protein [Arthrobacter roseus]